MPRVLITGIAGHLGSCFARWLLANVPGVEIIGLDDLSCGHAENVPDEVCWLPVDIAKWGVQCQPVDYVYHFAAYAAEGLSPFIRSYNYQNNLIATAKVVNYCIRTGAKRLVFTSSMAVYGRGEPPFSEDAHCNPIDPYGVAKLAAEQDLQIAGEQHGLSWTIIRPHNLYGPGQSIWQRYRNVLGLWMRAALEGKPIRIYGDGLQRRAFSFIDDCLPCLWAAATREEAAGQIINLGGEQPIEIREAAYMASAVTGQGEVVHLEPRHEVKRAWCTVEKSQQLLGYSEDTGFMTGLIKMWAWAKEVWERYPERRNLRPAWELEVEKGLYGYWADDNSTETGLPSHRSRSALI